MREEKEKALTNHEHMKLHRLDVGCSKLFKCFTCFCAFVCLCMRTVHVSGLCIQFMGWDCTKHADFFLSPKVCVCVHTVLIGVVFL